MGETGVVQAGSGRNGAAEVGELTEALMADDVFAERVRFFVAARFLFGGFRRVLGSVWRVFVM